VLCAAIKFLDLLSILLSSLLLLSSSHFSFNDRKRKKRKKEREERKKEKKERKEIPEEKETKEQIKRKQKEAKEMKHVFDKGGFQAR
jgi:mannitol-specific phosphotransferase system IIBC component